MEQIVEPKKPRKRIVVLSAILALLIIGSVAGTCYLLWQQLELNHAAHETETSLKPAVVNDTPLGSLENPIDFTSLQAENPDIYAWIYVPGTDVNYPILKHPTDDSFYLDHNKDGEYAIEGAVYSESVNSTNFTDPVTLLYGHCLINGSMFSSLHNFKDEAFFAEHETLYIYTPQRQLTYRIVAAYEYDDRHIIKTNDFSNPSTVQTYFDSILHPETDVANVRADISLTTDSKIIQLSTCISPTEDTSLRYLVTGVLIDDQQTT